MKQKLLKTMLLLSALVAGTSMSWADEVVYSTGFESSDSFTATTTYNSTVTDGATGYQWTFYYGTPSTNDALTGSQSAQCRYYSSATSVEPYVQMNFNVSKVESISFSAKVSNTNLYLILQYSTDNGSNWTNAETFEVTTSKDTYSYTHSSAFDNVRFKFLVKHTSTINSGNQKFFLDDISIERPDVAVTSLSVKTAPTKVRYEVGETLDMSGFVLNADGEDVTSGYTMTMGGASISNGATLSSAGKKTITVAYGGKEVSQNISVGAVQSIAVTTPPTKTSYDTGDSFDATGMVVTASLSTGELSDPDTWTKTVTGYTVDPEDDLTPSDDEVTITYATKTATQTITVTNVAVTGVSVKASTIIEKGKTETLTPSFTPSNATNKTVSWESDDTGVATVTSAGVVTAVAAGTANITVTTDDGGKTATCVVTVVNQKGSADAPYSVSDVIDGTATGSDKYVVGYIVGSYKSGSKSNFGRNGDSNTNLAIADDPDEDDVDNTVAVQLPSGSIRTNFNVTDNPHFIGSAKILIKADIASYITSTGLKNTDEMSKLAEIVKITDASGFATYASDSPLDFTDKDIDAYIAITKGNGTGVTFTQVNKVPANTGLLIHYTGAKTEEIPVFNGTGAETVTSNKFVKGTGAAVATDGTTVWNYILNKIGGNIGFYKANGQKVAKNRAYLSILQSESASIKEFFGIDFEDDADSLEGVQGVQEVQGAIYNLAGQRLSKMQKGINIVNGKKIMVK